MAHFSYPSSWDFGCEPETQQQLFDATENFRREHSNLPQQPALFQPPPLASSDSRDNMAIGFGKYRTRTPLEVLAIDPGWLVWAKRETGRILCSDEVQEQAQRRYEQQAVRTKVHRRSGGFIPR